MTREDTIRNSSIFAFTGIWTWAERIRQNWNHRFEMWGEQHGDLHIDSYSFFCLWMTRKWRMKGRVDQVKYLMHECPKRYKHVVAHSFAGEVSLRAIDEGDTHIESVVLVQAATEANCRDNLINKLLGEGKVERFIVTYSANDRALRKATWWPPRLTRPLGYFGPDNMAAPSLVTPLDLRHMDHSDMWTDENFDSTCRWIVKETMGVNV